jgi:hypothetical protein
MTDKARFFFCYNYRDEAKDYNLLFHVVRFGGDIVMQNA